MARLKGIYILALDTMDQIYGKEEQRQIAEIVDLVHPAINPQMAADHLDVLRDIDVLFSGWGGPQLDQRFLDAAPNLKTVFYGAGAIGYMMTDEAWNRGIQITTANYANAIPVAEYCVATILFSLKQGWRMARMVRELRGHPPERIVKGAYGATIGLVSMGAVGRTLRQMLKAFDLRVIAYDPFISHAEADAMNIERVTLEELFIQSDVISIHTPLLDETRNLIRGRHLSAMKSDATIINTSRGPIVNEQEMIDVLMQRSDITAILDVTDPEPPVASSKLYDLPNVVLTPHIAGSLGDECRRMGHLMVEELRRYVSGEQMKWIVTPAMVEHTSHRPNKRRRVMAAV